MASGLDLKDQPLAAQLTSRAFFTATMLLTIASFWANFYIGAVDLQLQDEASIWQWRRCGATSGPAAGGGVWWPYIIIGHI